MESQDRCESYPINISLPEEELNYFVQYHEQNPSNDGDSVMDSSEDNSLNPSSSKISVSIDPENVKDDLEEDSIRATDITNNVLYDANEFIIDPVFLKQYNKLGSRQYVYSEHLSLYSVDEADSTVLRVQHKNQDHKLGDDFGAEIVSKKYYIKRDLYYNHVFCKINPDTVASEIKLVNGDELVLLNSEFMPHLSHQEVLEQIKHLPVDSGERISLVIRRSGKDTPWFSISALLVSTAGEDPIARDIQTSFAALPPRVPRNALLELENKSSVCMLIENHQIGTWTLQNNSSDNKAVVSLELRVTVGKTGLLAFVATIKKDENGYIFVDSNNSVCLDGETGHEFIYIADGEKRMFKHQESGMYLGYQDSNVCLKTDEYKFVRNPPKNYDNLGSGVS